MPRSLDVTARATITLSDAQMARYAELHKHAPDLTLEELIAEESANWWGDFEGCAVVEAEFID